MSEKLRFMVQLRGTEVLNAARNKDTGNYTMLDVTYFNYYNTAQASLTKT